MTDRLRTSINQTTVAVVALALVLSVIGPIGGVAAAPGLVVTQSPSSATVTPGETVDVTTTINVDALDTAGAGLAVDLPDGWTITEATSDGLAQDQRNEWLWFVPGGVSGDQTTTYTVQVPADAATGEYDITATGEVVGNGESLTTQATTAVTVETEPTNTAPTADAGADQTVGEESEVTLDASGSSDADGDSLTYTWTQTGGADVSLAGADTATPTFTAPALTESTTLEFAVTVDDGDAADTDSVSVTVDPVNADPSASFTVDPTSPETGETVTFDASGSVDADGSIAGYSWDLDGDGQADATGATATTTFDAAGDYAVDLMVTDDEGATATATQTVTVGEADDPEPPADTVDVSVLPAEDDLAPGDTATYDVVVTGADEVGGFEGNVTLSNADVAAITAVETPAADAFESVTVDGDSATIEMFLGSNTLDANENGQVVVATITVDVAETGSTDLTFGDDPSVYVADAAGNGYEIASTAGATIDVSFPPLAPGLGSPTNVDDDAVLEDVNGDGVFNAGDAQTLFAFLNDDQVEDNVERFDFNGDGIVNIGDAQAAFAQATSD